MMEKSTPTAYSADSTELDSFFNNPSTTAIRGGSEKDVDIENPRCCSSQRLIVGIIILLGVICLIIGIVLISLAKDKKECDLKPTQNQQQNPSENATAVSVCAPSEEATRVSLYKLLEKIQAEVFALNPNMLFYKPQTTKEEIRMNFKPYDPTPSEIKRRTDGAWRLLAEINDTNIDVAKLKPRERKAISQVKFYLRHVFGQPYEANYYTGDWMLGPNFFCWQPICYIGQEMSNHLPSFAPQNTSDMEAIRKILEAYKKSINRYIENVKLGVRSGMVGSAEECRAGLDSMKGIFSQIATSKAGVLNEGFVAELLKPSFYKGLTQEMQDEWQKEKGKTVVDSMKEFLIKNVGTPINNLLSYLENEHMSHCVPSNISSGLFNRPLKYVYTDGKPDNSRPTVRKLPTGESISGPQTYSSILSFFTTSDIAPDEVYNKGWEMVNKTYPQVLSLARQITGLEDTDAAVKQFKANLSSQDRYFNKVPFPANETGPNSFKLCKTIQGAMKFCPNRWAAFQRWLQASREAMSFLEPKTVHMFYFTGQKQTTPSCPVQLAPDFNPSSAAQSYDNSAAGPTCAQNCRYYIPFFLDNLGPVFSEWSVNAHEARPGHHTQVQGFAEHFSDKCGGVISWINQVSMSIAFGEGWGLYAEMLIAEDTDTYDDHLWQKYGALKWRLWRALRLVLDSGLHSKGMSRQDGLDLLAKYAWDTSDIAQKEMTRYQSGPGQASAYMIGQLMIQKLRDYAETTLKDDFNLKEFHYQILNQGSAPTSFLESHIKQFVACKLEPKTPGCELILQPANVEVKTWSANNAESKVFAEQHNHLKWPYPRRHYI